MVLKLLFLSSCILFAAGIPPAPESTAQPAPATTMDDTTPTGQLPVVQAPVEDITCVLFRTFGSQLPAGLYCIGSCKAPLECTKVGNDSFQFCSCGDTGTPGICNGAYYDRIGVYCWPPDSCLPQECKLNRPIPDTSYRVCDCQ